MLNSARMTNYLQEHLALAPLAYVLGAYLALQLLLNVIMFHVDVLLMMYVLVLM